jgi:hypothetical protein
LASLRGIANQNGRSHGNQAQTEPDFFRIGIRYYAGSFRASRPTEVQFLSSAAMIAAYAAAGYIVWNQLSANVEQDVMETARLMLGGARAMRVYTTTQMAPLLDQEQAKVEHGVQNMRQALDVQIPAALQK